MPYQSIYDCPQISQWHAACPLRTAVSINAMNHVKPYCTLFDFSRAAHGWLVELQNAGAVIVGASTLLAFRPV